MPEEQPPQGARGLDGSRAAAERAWEIASEFDDPPGTRRPNVDLGEVELRLKAAVDGFLAHADAAWAQQLFLTARPKPREGQGRQTGLRRGGIARRGWRLATRASADIPCGHLNISFGAGKTEAALRGIVELVKRFPAEIAKTFARKSAAREEAENENQDFADEADEADEDQNGRAVDIGGIDDEVARGLVRTLRFFIRVNDHKLSTEIRDRLNAMHPGAASVWHGPKAADPDEPTEAMCRRVQDARAYTEATSPSALKELCTQCPFNAKHRPALACTWLSRGSGSRAEACARRNFLVFRPFTSRYLGLGG